MSTGQPDEQQAPEQAKAKANPTKGFFVNMITRDIGLEDCILDLIDNSVDSAWKSAGSKPTGLNDGVDLSAFSIKLWISPDNFIIRDNCGGMTLEVAANYAFNFGKPEARTPEEYTIGVYGIGMKRAVFKLGNDIKVTSTYHVDEQKRQSFSVPILVGAWLESNDMPWDFDIDESDDLADDGVEIVVKALTNSTAATFSNPKFIQNLRRTIGRDYALHLQCGLNIELNDKAINGWKIEFLEGDEFAPMRIKRNDEVETDVTIEIIGGMFAEPPDGDEPEDVKEKDPSGWYVACNLRMVVAADRTDDTGWGTDDWPSWHPQYSGFVGIVLFSSPRSIALPLTTTKRNIDPTSEVFRRARPDMRRVTREWIDYTNARKQALEDAKTKEVNTKPISIANVKPMERLSVPAVVPKPTEPMTNITYAVPKEKKSKLASAFGNAKLSNRDVGLKSFDYAYADYVGED